MRLGDDVQREGRLTRRLRTVNLDDPAARHAADSQRQIERDAPGWNRIDLRSVSLAESHDRAFTELTLDLADRDFDRLLTVRHWSNRPFLGNNRHWFSSFTLAAGATRQREKTPCMEMRRFWLVHAN